MRRFDLVCFDVDGTLVQHPRDKVIWQILNEKFLGTDHVNEERLAKYRRGEISYAEWVALDIGDWQRAGATRSRILEGVSELTLVGGARETLETLAGAGCRLAVISGTLDLCLDTLFPDHPFDEVYTNRIHFEDDGRIAGWDATPFDMDGKARALREIAAREAIPLESCAFVGDHLNDVAAAGEAGFAIAFNPKCREIEEAADVVVRGDDLGAVLEHLLLSSRGPEKESGPGTLTAAGKETGSAAVNAAAARKEGGRPVDRPRHGAGQGHAREGRNRR